MKYNSGGLSAGMSLSDVAQLHSVSSEYLRPEFELGAKHELEHTSDPKEAERIALDHLVENPKYYTMLAAMEADAEKNRKKIALPTELSGGNKSNFDKLYADGGSIDSVYGNPPYDTQKDMANFDWDSVFAPRTAEEEAAYDERLKKEEGENIRNQKAIKAGGKNWNEQFLIRVAKVKKVIADFSNAANGKKLNYDGYLGWLDYVKETIEGLRILGFGAAKYADAVEARFLKAFEKSGFGSKEFKFAKGGEILKDDGHVVIRRGNRGIGFDLIIDGKKVDNIDVWEGDKVRIPFFSNYDLHTQRVNSTGNGETRTTFLYYGKDLAKAKKDFSNEDLGYEPYFAEGGEINEDVYMAVSNSYQNHKDQYSSKDELVEAIVDDVEEKVGYKPNRSDVIAIVKEQKDNYVFFAEGGEVGKPQIVVKNGNTEVTVGNWVFYFHGTGDHSKLVDIYHKPTDLSAQFINSGYVISVADINNFKGARGLIFTHPTLGDFDLRRGFAIMKERPSYVDGSMYAAGGTLDNLTAQQKSDIEDGYMASKLQIDGRWINNGNRWAQEFEKNYILSSEPKPVEYYDQIIDTIVGGKENRPKFMNNDDFWEDFITRAEELGKPMKYSAGGETEEYVTIWSRPKNSHDMWVDERNHTLTYAKYLVGTNDYGHEKEINGRIFAFFKEGFNPNNLIPAIKEINALKEKRNKLPHSETAKREAIKKEIDALQESYQSSRAKMGMPTYAQGGELTRNQEIAGEIIKQLGGMNKLVAMTGAYGFAAVENGVRFKLKSRKANYVKIILNEKDLYDVEIGKIHGHSYKIVKEAKDVYFDQLKPMIEQATQMYLSLAKGGKSDGITKEKVCAYWRAEEMKDKNAYKDANTDERNETEMGEDAQRHFGVETDNGQSEIEQSIFEWAVDYTKK